MLLFQLRLNNAGFNNGLVKCKEIKLQLRRAIFAHIELARLCPHLAHDPSIHSIFVFLLYMCVIVTMCQHETAGRAKTEKTKHANYIFACDVLHIRIHSSLGFVAKWR